MRTIGIRDLKTHLSEILRQVHEEGQVIEVTNHGEIVARVVPVRKGGWLKTKSKDQAESTVWTDLERLAAEIGTHLPERVDAVQAVRDVRREL